MAPGNPEGLINDVQYDILLHCTSSNMAYNEGKWQVSLWPHSPHSKNMSPNLETQFFSVALKHAGENTVWVKVTQTFCCSSHYSHTVSHTAVHFITEMPASQSNTVISHLFHINRFKPDLVSHLSIIISNSVRLNTWC